MDWANIFISVVFLGIVVRLILIMVGPLTFEDKIGKASNWLIGLVLLAISWGILNVIWGNRGGSLFKGHSLTPNKQGYFEKEETPQKNKSKDTEETDIIIK